MLATTGDLKDISSKNSSKAFYAYIKNLPQEKNDLVANRMAAMRAEIPGRMNEANITDFRAKYDPECKAYLYEVWCETYGPIDANACKR